MARHLYCAAGDLTVDEYTSTTDRARLRKLKDQIRPLIVRESTADDLIAASPRIITFSGPRLTILEALAASLTEERARAIGDAIDPKLVELSTHYLGGVHWDLSRGE